MAALRSFVNRTAANVLRIANRGSNTYATSTAAKMKAYTPAAEFFPSDHRRNALRGDFVPVYVALGMITLSVALGLHTAKQHLFYSPAVYVRKKRRETIPEVVEPEHVAEEAEKFFTKSFFRKVAHVLKLEKLRDYTVPYEPVHGDAFAHSHHIETLRSVGVDPAPT